MSAETEVARIYNEFLASIQEEAYDEDELFDLEYDLARAIISAEYTHLNLDDNDSADEELIGTVERYIGEISDRIRRKQKPERTAKMVRLTLKRGRAILDRIKPKIVLE